MLPQLKFNKKMFQALSEGKKTATRRKEPKDICGGLYFSAVCTETGGSLIAKCKRTYTQKISDMTGTDAVMEGFADLDLFKDEICDIYGKEYLDSDPTMWVCEFEIIGKPAQKSDNRPSDLD